MNWNSDQLWNKAKLYLRRAFETGRDSDLFPFWATVGLEFFGRAILSKINPCLLADPQSGENFLYACGFEHATDRPKSVPAKTVFLRIKTITEAFTDADFGFVMSLMDRRNEELHSGTCPFEDLPNKKWLPRYYRICQLLCDSHSYSFDELFGTTESAIANRVIAETDEECISNVKKRVAAYKLTFDQMDERVRREKRANFDKAYLLVRGPKKLVGCPSCGSEAIVTGEQVGTSDPTLVEDEICQETTVIPTALGCEVCGLHLKGLPELHAAELDDQFVVRTCYPVTEYYENDFREAYFEPEYMNS